MCLWPPGSTKVCRMMGRSTHFLVWKIGEKNTYVNYQVRFLSKKRERQKLEKCEKILFNSKENLLFDFLKFEFPEEKSKKLINDSHQN